MFGMYGAPTNEFASIKELGIDFVMGPKEKTYLEAARRAGLKVVGTGKQFPRDRNLIGNYLSDEPDLWGMAPEKMAAEYEAAKKKSSKPVFLNLSSGYSAEHYAPFCDVLMFDWYPIGWQPIETYYANLRVARIAAGEKPLFATVQGFDWSHYPKLMPAKETHRSPTPTELKAMTVWAAMSGASGIAFYAYDDGHTKLKQHPDLEAAIKEAIQFIRSSEEFFTSEREWVPYPFRYRAEADKYNGIRETSIAVKASRANQKSDLWWIVAANTTDRSIEVDPAAGVTFIDADDRIQFAPFEFKLMTAVFEQR